MALTTLIAAGRVLRDFNPGYDPGYFTSGAPTLVVYYVPLPTNAREIAGAALALFIGIMLGRLKRKPQ